MASLFALALATRRANGLEWPKAMRWESLVYLDVRRDQLLGSRRTAAAVLFEPRGAEPHRHRQYVSTVLVGIALGVGVNLKVSAVIYLFPALALVWRKHGPGKFATAAAIAVLVAALPFAFHNISLAGYLTWVRAATGQGLRLWALPTALEWTIVLTIPMLLSGRSETAPRGVSDMVVFRRLVIASMLVSLPIAAKHGTGIYHFLPFVPSIIFAACTGTEDRATVRRSSHARVVRPHRRPAAAALGDRNHVAARARDHLGAETA